VCVCVCVCSKLGTKIPLTVAEEAVKGFAGQEDVCVCVCVCVCVVN
jgi:hypothetical protein